MSALGQPGGTGWGGRWEGLSGWREHMYAYRRFIVMIGKKKKKNHNIVK